MLDSIRVGAAEPNSKELSQVRELKDMVRTWET
jgi:hypothetical protein